MNALNLLLAELLLMKHIFTSSVNETQPVSLGDHCDAAQDDQYHDIDSQSHDGDNQYHDGDDQFNDGDYQDPGGGDIGE